MNGAILQQVFVVEFVIQYQMCDDCHRVEAKDFWKAVVQVRQKVCVCAYAKWNNIFFLSIRFSFQTENLLTFHPLKYFLKVLYMYAVFFNFKKKLLIMKL